MTIHFTPFSGVAAPCPPIFPVWAPQSAARIGCRGQTKAGRGMVGYAGSEDRGSGPLPRAVRRVLELLELNSAKSYSLAELAGFAEVPPRTLQRQFLRFVGMSLRAKLHELRFEHCRRDLLQAAPGVGVADIAQRRGFAHLGRFAVEYRQRYGETPSATLARNARAAALRSRSATPLFSHFEAPTVAVLPIHAGPEETSIAGGVTDEIAAALMRGRAARVADPSAARYHVVGSLRRENRTLRLTLRVIEPAMHLLLWASSYDGLADQSFAFEEYVAVAAAAAIRAGLQAAEMMRLRRRAVIDLTAHQLALRALPSVVALERSAATEAIELLGESLDRDPGQPLTMALAAWCHAQRVIYEFTESPAEERARALALARKAAEGPAGDDALVLAILGNTYNAIHDLETARVMTDRAVALDGASAWGWGRSGWIETYSGNAAAAIERLGIALHLNPADALAPSFQTGIGCAFFQAGKYREATRWLSRVVSRKPSAAWAHRVLCPAYVLMGRPAEAARSLAALHESYPDSTIASVVSALPMTRDFLDRVAEGLETAGLPLR